MDVVRKVVKEEEEYKMKIKILEKNEQKLTFELTESNETFANTLRRIMISEVPTMAIDEINFFANDSALYDEVLAHRIGLIPLTTDLKIYNLPENCKCKGEGCNLCRTIISLKSEGPKMVYAEELTAEDEEIKAYHPKMPLVLLLEGQKIKFEATAILGLGKNHAKYMPGAIFYKHKAKLRINNSHADFDKFKDKYPKQAFKDGKLDEEKLLRNDLYQACANINKDILAIKYDRDNFIFKVESFGQLAPEEILRTAIEKLNEKTGDFAKAIKKDGKKLKLPSLKRS